MIQGEPFIVLLKSLLIVVIVMAVAGAFWLVFQNRDSEKVIQAFYSAVAVGALGVLITVLFGLKSEVREVEFPALFTYEKASLQPYGLAHNLGYASPSERWASIHLQELIRLHPQVFKEETNDPGLDLYGDLALRLVFDALLQTFGGTWDVKMTKRDFPLVGWGVGGYDEHSPKSDIIPLSKISALFPKSYALQTPPILFAGEKLAIPAGTKLTGRADRNTIGGFAQTFIFMENDFVDLEISIKLRGGVANIGIYSLVTQVSDDEAVKAWTANYLISMKAKFKAYRSGHPDMPKYKAWVDNIFEAVRGLLDSQLHWERKAKETHQDLGRRIDRIENAVTGLQATSDQILLNLPKPKQQK